MPLHSHYPEPDGFKGDTTHTYWVSHSRWAYTQNTQNASISLSIGRGLDLAGKHPRVRLSIHILEIEANHHKLNLV